MAKKPKNNPILVVGVLAVLVVGILAFTGTFSQSTLGGDDSDSGVCTLDSIGLTISAYDTENPGTALTEATNLYRKVGTTTWKTFTAGTQITGLEVAEYEFIMGITTSDFTDNAYGQYFTYDVECVADASIEFAMADDEVETSLTAVFYNADGDASAETFTAGETQTVSIKLKASTDNYFGNPYSDEEYPNVLVIGLNSTEWDAPEQVYLADGTELSKVETPGRQSLSSGIQYYAYELPVITDKEVRVYLDLNADDTNAPATDMTAYVYAGNWFINGDTAEVDFGVETEEDVAVGTDASDSVALDFTA